MPTSASAGNAPRTQGERRRSQRVLLVIPVEVEWERTDGSHAKEYAETEEVNAHGALLRLKPPIALPAEFELTRRKTRQRSRVRLVGTHPPEPDGLERVAVELAVPSETFWGVSIPTTERTVAR